MTGCHSTNTPPWNEQFLSLKNTPGPQKDKKLSNHQFSGAMLVSGRVDSTEWDLFKWLSNRMAWYGQTIFNSKRLLHELRLGVTRHVSKCSIYQGIFQKMTLIHGVNNELVLNRFTQWLHHRLTREFKNGSSFGGDYKTILMGWEREKCWKWTLDFGENSILHPLKRA